MDAHAAAAAAMAEMLIAAGVARCAACHGSVDHDDAPVVLYDRTGIAVHHETCVPTEYKMDLLHQKMRRNWRWN